jgi:hypothetical protein
VSARLSLLLAEMGCGSLLLLVLAAAGYRNCCEEMSVLLVTTLPTHHTSKHTAKEPPSTRTTLNTQLTSHVYMLPLPPVRIPLQPVL